jgi:Flp pilus assembly protein protease CpaA
MVRPDRSTKIAYALAGAVIGAILIRVFVLLKRREARAAEGAQMSSRLEQVTG